MEHTLQTRNALIAQLIKSPHGKLDEYRAVGATAAKEDPEFFAHLVAWNQAHGSIRDAKVALPVLALGNPSANLYGAFQENALAHLAMQSPRDLVRALDFAKGHTSTHGRAITRVVHRYLRTREMNAKWWERTVMQHRSDMKALYARTHFASNGRTQTVLFGKKGALPPAFETLRQLKNMPADEVAGAIIKYQYPFLTLTGALGSRLKEPDIVLALIDRMSPTELVTNTKMLERLGIKTNPSLRAAYEQALGRVETKTKGQVPLLKTTRAAEAVDDEKLKAKLQATQERQLSASKGIEGNWLILADKSGSMTAAIETARHIAAIIARLVKGQVHLVFFDVTPRHLDVTGKTLDEITEATKHVHAQGGTSIGCGLHYAIMANLDVNGIAIVSDGGENNHPYFHQVYQTYCTVTVEREVPVYFYHVPGDTNYLSQTMERAHQKMEVFDLPSKVDYYSLPNLVQTMRTNTYSLVDEIYATPLLTTDAVFNQ